MGALGASVGRPGGFWSALSREPGPAARCEFRGAGTRRWALRYICTARCIRFPPHGRPKRGESAAKPTAPRGPLWALGGAVGAPVGFEVRFRIAFGRPCGGNTMDVPEACAHMRICTCIHTYAGPSRVLAAGGAGLTRRPRASARFHMCAFILK